MPAVCFTSSTALIRWEPLCSTARLIIEAQSCAAAEEYTLSFKHIHPGQTNCVGGLRAAYTHRKHTCTSILRTVRCPFLLHYQLTHTLIHICTFFEEPLSWIQSVPGLVESKHLVALTSQVYPVSFTYAGTPQLCGRDCAWMRLCVHADVFMCVWQGPLLIIATP